MDTTTPSPRPEVANTQQAAAWNGGEGANWANRHAPTTIGDAGLFAPLLATAAIERRGRVLDIGCGIGELTRLAARRAAGGHALGIDLSTLMIARADAAADEQRVPNVAFEVGDAQVHQFRPRTYDVAISHFGIMFFDDPVAAFANVGRALRGGGRLVFVCPQSMDRCDWYVVPLTALLGRQPAEADAPSRMFSLADPTHVRDVLGRAGFTEVALQPVDAALQFGPDLAAAVEFFAGSGPVRSLRERDARLSEQRTRELLTGALAPYETSNGIELGGVHWLVTAQSSGP